MENIGSFSFCVETDFAQISWQKSTGELIQFQTFQKARASGRFQNGRIFLNVNFEDINVFDPASKFECNDDVDDGYEEEEPSRDARQSRNFVSYFASRVARRDESYETELEVSEAAAQTVAPILVQGVSHCVHFQSEDENSKDALRPETQILYLYTHL